MSRTKYWDPSCTAAAYLRGRGDRHGYWYKDHVCRHFHGPFVLLVLLRRQHHHKIKLCVWRRCSGFYACVWAGAKHILRKELIIRHVNKTNTMHISYFPETITKTLQRRHSKCGLVSIRPLTHRAMNNSLICLCAWRRLLLSERYRSPRTRLTVFDEREGGRTWQIIGRSKDRSKGSAHSCWQFTFWQQAADGLIKVRGPLVTQPRLMSGV